MVSTEFKNLPYKIIDFIISFQEMVNSGFGCIIIPDKFKLPLILIFSKLSGNVVSLLIYKFKSPPISIFPKLSFVFY
jgi:hypothetical protein